MDALNIRAIVSGLVSDLEQLRSGEITIPMARARAALGHQILRGVSLVFAGQKFIEGQAIKLPSAKKSKNKSSKIIDAEAAKSP
jgi:hypothetical protein